MKYIFLLFILCRSFVGCAQSWIRVNQLGYLPDDVKVAVLVSKDKNIILGSFCVCNALTGNTIGNVFEVPTSIIGFTNWAGFEKSFRLNFSSFNLQGSYFIKTNINGEEIRSSVFKIGNDVYDGTGDFLLNYMRQQRCGYNPLLRDSCHTAGCFVVYGKDKNIDSVRLPIWGGWHDASDYLQYSTTSANAVFQMLLAYEKNPNCFPDKFDAAGLPTPNGIPDILDEVKWGLDWLCRMNPAPDVMFNQIADDRDHRYMRLPNTDTIIYDYKFGKARPVYLVTGEPQGLGKYKNRTQGVSSTAGKFAAAFAAGARLLKQFYPNFSDSLQTKAVDAFRFATSKLGVCQTAPNRAPYFYEEDNFYDDLELAATQLFRNTGNFSYKTDALKFGLAEGGSKWMGTDTARHYQYYPFVNAGHAEFFNAVKDSTRENFVKIYKSDLQKLFERGKDNPFLMGVPFVWCSNNYVAAALTELDLFLADSTKNFDYVEGHGLHQITGDISFYESFGRHSDSTSESVLFTRNIVEMRVALRDWLFGCNPWGTSMIYGLPRKGVAPRDPHSAFTHIGHYDIDGGLVDGPIYGSIFKQLIGLKLFHSDSFSAFQSPLVVYHDDYGDYSSNEPTMDGTASLTYFLSALQQRGDAHKTASEKAIVKSIKDKFGTIVRFDTTQKTIRLVFTGHEWADGGNIILKTLRKNKLKASFFFTGDFVRKYPQLVKRVYKDGHYVGAHSDKHLLYCDWTKRDATLINKDSFANDLAKNFQAFSKLKIETSRNNFFMPPFEWYNQDIADWTSLQGFRLINFTSGTSSNADYTTPEEKNYKSSATILKNIDDYEKKNTLNGFILLSHIGTDPKRTDKFYRHLSTLIKNWKQKGYGFERL